MLALDLINKDIPRLKPQDSIGKALQLINDFGATHLPVVYENKYLGLISEDDLLDAASDSGEKSTIEYLRSSYIPVSVREKDHFLNAVNLCISVESNVTPVTKDGEEYLGSIYSKELLKYLGNFAGANEIGGIVVLEIERSQFALSEISRIVENNDCTILHLNTITDPITGLLTVTLHINKREISAVVATFERYDYDVVYYNGNESFENEISSNYQNLMNYLDI